MTALRSVAWVAYNIALLIVAYWWTRYFAGPWANQLFAVVLCVLVLSNIHVFLRRRREQLTVLRDEVDTAEKGADGGERRSMGSRSEADTIDGLLALALTEIASKDEGRRKLLSHRSTGRLWELRQTRGRGTRQLHELALKLPEDWR